MWRLYIYYHKHIALLYYHKIWHDRKKSQNEIWSCKAHVAHGLQILVGHYLFLNFWPLLWLQHVKISSPHQCSPYNFFNPHNWTHIFFSTHIFQPNFFNSPQNSAHIFFSSTYNCIYIIFSTHTKSDSHESTSPQMVAIYKHFTFHKF